MITQTVILQMATKGQKSFELRVERQTDRRHTREKHVFDKMILNYELAITGGGISGRTTVSLPILCKFVSI